METKEPWIDSRLEQESFVSCPALGSNQPSTHWIRGSEVFLRGKAENSAILMPRIRMRGTVPPFLHMRSLLLQWLTTEPSLKQWLTTERNHKPWLTTEPSHKQWLTTEPSPKQWLTTEPSPKQWFTTEPSPKRWLTTQNVASSLRHHSPTWTRAASLMRFMDHERPNLFLSVRRCACIISENTQPAVEQLQVYGELHSGPNGPSVLCQFQSKLLSNFRNACGVLVGKSEVWRPLRTPSGRYCENYI